MSINEKPPLEAGIFLDSCVALGEYKNVQVPPPYVGDGVGSERKLWVRPEVI